MIDRDVRAFGPHLILVGLPGVGKTTIGKAAAKQLGRQFLDFDKEIERRAGMDVREIIANHALQCGEIAARLRGAASIKAEPAVPANRDSKLLGRTGVLAGVAALLLIAAVAVVFVEKHRASKKSFARSRQLGQTA